MGDVYGVALCSGIGGLELGLRLALGRSYHTICYVEREAFAAACLVARMEDKVLDLAPVWSDLTSFDGRAWRGLVDIVSAGYPCQPFSPAGKRRGEDDPRHLWPHVRRVVRECEAPFLFCENVPGHLSLGFDTVLADLGADGFRVAADVFSAWEVGAGHERERLFFLAHRDGAGRAVVRQRGLLDGQRPAQRDDTDGRGGPSVGDPDRPRLEGRGLRVGRRGDERPAGPAGRSFPPRRDDLDEWRRVLAIRPDLEPSVRRVAHGRADRNDRLRVLGNSVVPDVAARAFVVLAQRLLQG